MRSKLSQNFLLINFPLLFKLAKSEWVLATKWPRRFRLQMLLQQGGRLRHKVKCTNHFDSMYLNMLHITWNIYLESYLRLMSSVEFSIVFSLGNHFKQGSHGVLWPKSRVGNRKRPDRTNLPVIIYKFNIFLHLIIHLKSSFASENHSNYCNHHCNSNWTRRAKSSNFATNAKMDQMDKNLKSNKTHDDNISSDNN